MPAYNVIHLYTLQIYIHICQRDNWKWCPEILASAAGRHQCAKACYQGIMHLLFHGNSFPLHLLLLEIVFCSFCTNCSLLSCSISISYSLIPWLFPVYPFSLVPCSFCIYCSLRRLSLERFHEWFTKLKMLCTSWCYLKLIYGDPRIGRKVLQHWNEKLETPVPVTNQKHHADEVEDAHEHPRHAQELRTNHIVNP